MRPAIILFAKAPIAGRVKTRLQPEVSPAQAAALHEAFVRDMLASLLEMADRFDIELHTDTCTDAFSDVKVARRLQIEGDLGRRMRHAIEAGLGEGRPQVMIVGSDAPNLPIGYLARLLASPAAVALGPAEDGGYYAISCRAVAAGMFARVEWSSPDALRQTVEACQACGLTTELGEPWSDIDTARDLARLILRGGLPRHTQAWIEQSGLKLEIEGDREAAAGAPPPYNSSQ
jgi:rSAM/selenodomain-associated transferase 1